jgi:hypothetical protein
VEERLFPVDPVKRCCTCKQIKPLTEFNRMTKSKDGRQGSCRECNQAYHYAHWDRHMAQIKARRKRQREAAQAFIIEYLRRHPCVDCGESDIIVLEFDHLRDKAQNVSYLVNTNELRRIKAEIEKCEVVCANCHRRRTAQRGRWYRTRAD